MNNNLQLRRLGYIEKIADCIMTPLMYLISSTFLESPQRTHRWNNTKLTSKDTEFLSREKMVFSPRIPIEKPAWKFNIPLMHIPIIGGWRNYLVLEPIDYAGEWHVGWITPDLSGVSLIPVSGPVRVLASPKDVHFFGVRSGDGTQLELKKIATGYIGNRDPYSDRPLL